MSEQITPFRIDIKDDQLGISSGVCGRRDGRSLNALMIGRRDCRSAMRRRSRRTGSRNTTGAGASRG